MSGHMFVRSVMILLLLLGGWCRGQAIRQVKFLEVDTLLREYILYIPASVAGQEAVPLVLNFHGLGLTNSIQEIYTQMNAVADAEGFILAYPQGVDNLWNVAIEELQNEGIDDVGFIDALLDTLLAHYPIDPERVYTTGMSLGGFMSYRLACQLSERIAGVASVAGLMSHELAAICDPQRPMPVLHIHGIADPTVAYNGDDEFISVDALLRLWQGFNACEPVPAITELPDRVPGDQSFVLQLSYPCAEGGALVHYMIQNGGHTWPGAIPVPGEGVTNYDMLASEKIWRFFQETSDTSLVHRPGKLSSEKALRLFPNPHLNAFTVQASEPIQRIELHDVHGKVLLRASLPHRPVSWTVGTHGLPAGVYLLMVHSGEQVRWVRLEKRP